MLDRPLFFKFELVFMVVMLLVRPSSIGTTEIVTVDIFCAYSCLIPRFLLFPHCFCVLFLTLIWCLLL